MRCLIELFSVCLSTEQTELIPGDAFPPDAFGTIPGVAYTAREVSYTKLTSANALVRTRSPQKTRNVSKSSADFPEFPESRVPVQNPDPGAALGN